MKKFALLILLSTIFFITNCSEKKTIEPKYQNLTLTAPNGQQIAESFESINEEIKDMVAQQFGKDIPFEITSIDYTDVSDGYFALITYQLENGMVLNYALSNSLSVFNNSSVKTLRIEITSDNHIK